MRHLDPRLLDLIVRDDLFGALRLLNTGTDYRFTGIYTFDFPQVKNVVLFDRQSPNIEIGADVLWNDAYCRLTAVTGSPLVVTDSLTDDRLVGHPVRDSLRFYCGVPLRTPDDKPLGTLCHYDLAPQAPVSDDTLERLSSVRADVQKAVWSRLRLTAAPALA